MDIGAFQSQGFTLTPVAGSTPQNATSGTAFANPLSVTVTANNSLEPVAAGVIDFSAPTSGASAALSGGTVTIGTNGVASITATANAVAGSYSVIASASGVAAPAFFLLTNVTATTPPTSHVVNSLGTSQTSDTFSVSVTFSDPAGPGAPAPGVSAVELWVSVNNGAFTLSQTMNITPADSGTVTFSFTGQDRNIYAFHSITIDAAGNVESKNSNTIEASTSVPDLHPPVTELLTSSTYSSSTGVFSLNWSGTDPDQNTGTPAGSIALVDVYVEIDGGDATLITQINGPTASGRVYSGSLTYDALADNQSHTYGFFSIGTDDEQKAQATPSTPNVTFSNIVYSAPLAVQNFMVEKGIAERSFIEYLDVDFNQTASSSAYLTALANELGSTTATNKPSYLELLWYGGGTPSASAPKGSVNLFGSGTTATLTLTGDDLSINFGANGITSLLTETGVSGTGKPTTNFGDGWYALGIDTTGGNGPVFWEPFFRLFGSATGDTTVTGPYTMSGTDAYVVYNAEGQSGTLLNADVDGSGAVNSKDLTYTAAAKGDTVGGVLQGLPTRRSSCSPAPASRFLQTRHWLRKSKCRPWCPRRLAPGKPRAWMPPMSASSRAYRFMS